jgi:aspartate/methionine/tyrosine aminotransferase
MTGWRLGWLVTPNRYWASLIERLAQNLFIAPPTLSQHAAMECFTPESKSIMEQRRHTFLRRREFLQSELKKIGFSIPSPPRGAFYLYANIDAFNMPSNQLTDLMLKETGVAATPGTDFGQYRADNHIRFAYTTDVSRLEEGVNRLRILFE